MSDLLNHWRKMYENKYLGAWDLCNKDGRYIEVQAQIRDIRWEEIVGEGGRKERKLVLYLQGSKGPIPAPLILSKPNGKTLEGMFGADPRKWIGKGITLYALDKKVKGQLAKVVTVRSGRASQAMREDLEQRQAPPRQPAFDDADATPEPAAEQEPEPEPDGRL